MAPAPDDIDQPFEVASEGNNGIRYGAPQSCDGECAERVVEAARDAITGGDSDTGTDPTDAFEAAIDAAHSPDGTEDATATEEIRAPVQGNEAAAYRAAFEAAKEARLDDEAAREAAEVAVAEASKTRKGGFPSEGIAAAEGKTSKASKDKPRKEEAREEETTEDTDEEVAASIENRATGGEMCRPGPQGAGFRSCSAG